MKSLLLWSFSALFSLICFAQDKTYYISATGNDNNNGLSQATAWRSIERMNTHAFKPGDKILLKAGDVFEGSVVLDEVDKGSKTSPIVVNTYGNGKATIQAPDNNKGFYIYNTGGIEINNLIIAGSGANINLNNGIDIFMDQSLIDIEHIYVDSVEVYGFGNKGINISTWDYSTNQSSTKKSYHDIRITHTIAHDNGYAGIYSEGDWPSSNHTQLYIAYCKAYNNKGLLYMTNAQSGNGIMISGFDGGMIEYCEAYNNGEYNSYPYGGPIGMWVWDAKNITIQYCESYNNKSGGYADGGGFDIDGGAQNCIIQYCYSHDNEGAGFALFEYGSPNEFLNNIIRYNISQNDGRRHGYGALMFWGAIKDCQVYNNTIYMDNNGVQGAPAAIKITSGNMSNIKVHNNIFYVNNTTTLVSSNNERNSQSVLLQNNNYFSSSNTYNFYWGSTVYNSFSTWRSNTGQEIEGNNLLGTTDNPLFINPGGGVTIHPASGGDLTKMTAYQVQPGSLIIDAGKDLQQSYGLDVGTKDFYNNPIYLSSTFDLGAHEFNPSFYTTLPLKFTRFTATKTNEVLNVEWSAINNNATNKFTIEISDDGRAFQTLKELSVNESLRQIQKEVNLTGVALSTFYCRIKAESRWDNITYSTIIKIDVPNKVSKYAIYPNPVQRLLNVQLEARHEFTEVYVLNSIGDVIFKKPINKQESNVKFEVSGLSKGIYFIELIDKKGKKTTHSVTKL